jgi:hypothetical protein
MSCYVIAVPVLRCGSSSTYMCEGRRVFKVWGLKVCLFGQLSHAFVFLWAAKYV